MGHILAIIVFFVVGGIADTIALTVSRVWNTNRLLDGVDDPTDDMVLFRRMGLSFIAGVFVFGLQVAAAALILSHFSASGAAMMIVSLVALHLIVLWPSIWKLEFFIFPKVQGLGGILGTILGWWLAR